VEIFTYGQVPIAYSHLLYCFLPFYFFLGAVGGAFFTNLLVRGGRSGGRAGFRPDIGQKPVVM